MAKFKNAAELVRVLTNGGPIEGLHGVVILAVRLDGAIEMGRAGDASDEFAKLCRVVEDAMSTAAGHSPITIATGQVSDLAKPEKN
jgi:hypothetical protein